MNRDHALSFAIQNRRIPLEYKNDKSFILELVGFEPYNLSIVPKKFQDDKDVVMQAVNNNGDCLRFASDKIRADKEIVLTAVRDDGMALEYASDNLKKDAEVVLTAIACSGHALLFGSKELTSNFDFMLDAVNIDGNSLRYASTNLQKNPTLVRAAAISMVRRYGANEIRTINSKYFDDEDFRNSIANAVRDYCRMTCPESEIRNTLIKAQKFCVEKLCELDEIYDAENNGYFKSTQCHVNNELGSGK